MIKELTTKKTQQSRVCVPNKEAAESGHYTATDLGGEKQIGHYNWELQNPFPRR